MNRTPLDRISTLSQINSLVEIGTVVTFSHILKLQGYYDSLVDAAPRKICHAYGILMQPQRYYLLPICHAYGIFIKKCGVCKGYQ
jgi:hypothetical protein